MSHLSIVLNSLKVLYLENVKVNRNALLNCNFNIFLKYCVGLMELWGPTSVQPARIPDGASDFNDFSSESKTLNDSYD